MRHGRAAAAVPRVELPFKGASRHAWVRWGGVGGGAMTEGGVRRKSSGGADTSRRAGSEAALPQADAALCCAMRCGGSDGGALT